MGHFMREVGLIFVAALISIGPAYSRSAFTPLKPRFSRTKPVPDHSSQLRVVPRNGLSSSPSSLYSLVSGTSDGHGRAMSSPYSMASGSNDGRGIGVSSPYSMASGSSDGRGIGVSSPYSMASGSSDGRGIGVSSPYAMASGSSDGRGMGVSSPYAMSSESSGIGVSSPYSMASESSDGRGSSGVGPFSSTSMLAGEASGGRGDSFSSSHGIGGSRGPFSSSGSRESGGTMTGSSPFGSSSGSSGSEFPLSMASFAQTDAALGQYNHKASSSGKGMPSPFSVPDTSAGPGGMTGSSFTSSLDAGAGPGGMTGGNFDISGSGVDNSRFDTSLYEQDLQEQFNVNNYDHHLVVGNPFEGSSGSSSKNDMLSNYDSNPYYSLGSYSIASGSGRDTLMVDTGSASQSGLSDGLKQGLLDGSAGVGAGPFNTDSYGAYSNSPFGTSGSSGSRGSAGSGPFAATTSAATVGYNNAGSGSYVPGSTYNYGNPIPFDSSYDQLVSIPISSSSSSRHHDTYSNTYSGGSTVNSPFTVDRNFASSMATVGFSGTGMPGGDPSHQHGSAVGFNNYKGKRALAQVYRRDVHVNE